jgi:alpha-amylase
MEPAKSPVPPRFHLSLLIHAHQPCGNFEHVFEECYQRAYRPFLELLAKHPSIHLGLHYSGPLLLWIEAHHPEYFESIRSLVSKGQVELVGGGFYEPILVSIPAADQREQILRLAGYVEEHFGKRPSGAWLAERVWEPQLPSVLAAAEVWYTVVDDIHFLSAGFEPQELFGTYVAEDRGYNIRLFPGQKALRYLVPFGTVPDVIAYLKECAASHPGGVAAMGDDLEKFGVWPGTAKHCYEDCWLESFFTALEENSDWLCVCAPAEYLANHAPLGRADLPTASYPEMMEWVLPTSVRQRYNRLQREFQQRPEVLSFLRGGSWRGFFRKYPESNLLNKKMLRVSARIAAAHPRRAGSKAFAELAAARDLLHRAQCNDAYWHGIFGGLYAPHLRADPWRNLIRAEATADRLAAGGNIPRIELVDYDSDGANELVFTAPEYQALLKPSDGGTLAALDFRPAAATLINSIQRRPEAYHARLRDAAQAPAGGVASIHEQTRVKEPNLERFLHYDRWPRHAFRLLLFDPARTLADYETLRLQEDQGAASGVYSIVNSAPSEAELYHPGAVSRNAGAASQSLSGLTVTKRFSFGHSPCGFEVMCEIELQPRTDEELHLAAGLESIVNFLAPTEPDRFFETPDGPRNLRFNGSLPAPLLHMQDGWQRVRVTLHAPGAQEFWVAPIETVSESEDGFERVYQGSQILALWKPVLAARKAWSARLVWRIEQMRG